MECEVEVGRTGRQGRTTSCAGGAPGVHVVVSRCDVVEAVGAMDRHDGLAGRDGVEEAI